MGVSSQLTSTRASLLAASFIRPCASMLHSHSALRFNSCLSVKSYFLNCNTCPLLSSSHPFAACHHTCPLNRPLTLTPQPSWYAQAWYMHPLFSILIGGILPFGAVFIELFFILTSMWLHQFYYLFGFLCLVFVILVITCAEITIVLCYFQLCSEDYHWWYVASLQPDRPHNGILPKLDCHCLQAALWWLTCKPPH